MDAVSLISRLRLVNEDILAYTFEVLHKSGVDIVKVYDRVKNSLSVTNTHQHYINEGLLLYNIIKIESNKEKAVKSIQKFCSHYKYINQIYNIKEILLNYIKYYQYEKNNIKEDILENVRDSDGFVINRIVDCMEKGDFCGIKIKKDKIVTKQIRSGKIVKEEANIITVYTDAEKRFVATNVLSFGCECTSIVNTLTGNGVLIGLRFVWKEKLGNTSVSYESRNSSIVSEDKEICELVKAFGLV